MYHTDKMPPGLVENSSGLKTPGSEGRGAGKQKPSSPTDPESLDKGSVPPSILFPEVLQKPAALPDQHQQTAAGMMVLSMDLEMVGEAVDPFGEERDLHLRGAGVSFVGAVLLH
jgi:hypothetical protein